MKKTDKILVRSTNWIGDAVMTLPALSALRHAYPESTIALLAKSWVAPVFENNPAINQIIPYDASRYDIITKLGQTASIRRAQYDMALLLQNAFDAALITRLAGIPERIGYSRDYRGMLLTKAVPLTSKDLKTHQIEYYMNLLRQAGIPTPEPNKIPQPWIYLSPEERAKAQALLKGMIRPVVGLNPGAAYGSAKQWLPERFAEVARLVVRELGGSVVVFGGPSEKQIAAEIVSLSGLAKTDPDRILNVAGSTSLRELAGLLSDVDVLLSNDSGPMHMAYALRTPLVAIFGSTSYVHTGPPATKGNIVLNHTLDCAPCFERTCKLGTLACMKLITVEEAFRAIVSLLPKSPAVFFDRDGTLCEDAHFLNNWEGFKIFPDIAELQKLTAQGFHLIGVSNQSGIARGRVNEGFAKAVNEKFVQEHGFTDFYYCPHGPAEGCSCRKPEPGMVLEARAAHRVNLKHSFVVGDKDADMELAHAVGARSVLVRTGKQQSSPHADFSADNLAQAVRIILRNS